jgi:hypothetical protein
MDVYDLHFKDTPRPVENVVAHIVTAAGCHVNRWDACRNYRLAAGLIALWLERRRGSPRLFLPGSQRQRVPNS